MIRYYIVVIWNNINMPINEKHAISIHISYFLWKDNIDCLNKHSYIHGINMKNPNR